MTFAVPFDGSTLAEAALVRADEYARALDESVVAVSVVSSGPRYAMEKGWIDSASAFDVETVARKLWEHARALVPDVGFEYEVVRRRPPTGAVANAIRGMVRDVDPNVVFIGSDDAGSVATPVTSVGGTVAAQQSYDVYIVREPKPSEIAALDAHESFYEETS